MSIRELRKILKKIENQESEVLIESWRFIYDYQAKEMTKINYGLTKIVKVDPRKTWLLIKAE
jgi:hypothetical protein